MSNTAKTKKTSDTKTSRTVDLLALLDKVTKNDLADLDARIAMANAKLKSLQAARELIAVRLGESSHDEPEPVRSSSDVEPLTKQTPATKQAITKPEFTNAENAVRVLRDSGPDQPLTATQIAHRLITKFGIPDPGGRALESRIYTALGRRPDLFKKAGNGKWALVEHGKEWIT